MSEFNNDLLKSKDPFASENPLLQPNPLLQQEPEQKPVLVSEQELSQIAQNQLMLKKDPEIHALAQKIDVKDQIAMLELGKETANGISTFSDKMLATMKSSKLEESSVLLNNLNKIMDKFDPQDFADEKKGGFISKLFNKGKEQLEKFLSKYDSMNKEVDVIYREIQKYEGEMKRNTIDLENLYEQNLNYFQSLSKFVAAIEVKIEEVRAALPALEQKAQTGDQLAAMEYETMLRAVELLEQRRYDLEMAQQVSFQSAPQIRLMQQGNNHLIAKINSAFVTTIPIFKQGLIHAVTLKRQKLISDSMSELDRRTNEMLVRNAENISKNSVNIARQAGSPSIKIETIETTWQTIMSGIQETKQIQAETARNREEGRKRIERLQLEYEKLKKM
ncbi:toxic anion resistance protein [Lysinibacillus irui]|uniref:Toxic anion resistance protein n=1 Tax=Lysinibacillus irui TaxID=2998077 RepID=A0AAJ5UV18_9BACI|nr:MULTISPECIES: toxic anion resistance protein [Lysinibacillus]MEA0552397.1 toxic anion resistance protein [Lysinibacillus irui]MEA0564032.1 toxic anion resistance protein [Lysinibacillus irui]MEA0977530.1 toxic anion resistance protein [Lysinibacillus irui]MEA1043684.1 toxic anion resistance protein [Lysinibacillus irui]WDV08424.1 toxic anion resistance protein [Lysinibacillus irui]